MLLLKYFFTKSLYCHPISVIKWKVKENGGERMGRYLPVIKTAECGSLTRAAHALGYTQPSLGYIINNIENELGVKIFYRNQRGVTLTENGESLLAIMRQIEDMESHLQEVARISRWEMLRVGIFPSVASLWMPEILKEFYHTYPKVVGKAGARYERPGPAS